MRKHWLWNREYCGSLIQFHTHSESLSVTRLFCPRCLSCVFNLVNNLQVQEYQFLQQYINPVILLIDV